MIELYHVEKSYEAGRLALVNVTLHIARGEFVFVTGPSGAGKTTLFKLLYREEMPTRGHVLVDGMNTSSLSAAQVPLLRRKIGVVFQDFRLIEQKTVLENVALPLKVIGVSRTMRDERGLRALRQVGLEHKRNDWPSRLSGGEQQRAAIARALVVDPVILLADEPTGNLDPELAQEIMAILTRANIRGSTVVIATHDRDFIRRSSKRVISLENGGVVDERMALAPELA